MALTNFIFLDANQAGLVRGTTSLGHSLQPVEILNGPLAGNCVLPLAVLNDQSHISARLFLMSLPVINIDPVVAWLPPPESE